MTDDVNPPPYRRVETLTGVNDKRPASDKFIEELRRQLSVDLYGVARKVGATMKSIKQKYASDEKFKEEFDEAMEEIKSHFIKKVAVGESTWSNVKPIIQMIESGALIGVPKDNDDDGLSFEGD